MLSYFIKSTCRRGSQTFLKVENLIAVNCMLRLFMSFWYLSSLFHAGDISAYVKSFEQNIFLLVVRDFELAVR